VRAKHASNATKHVERAGQATMTRLDDALITYGEHKLSYIALEEVSSEWHKLSYTALEARGEQ
jgi:hypothetical protein